MLAFMLNSVYVKYLYYVYVKWLCKMLILYVYMK